MMFKKVIFAGDVTRDDVPNPRAWASPWHACSEGGFSYAKSKPLELESTSVHVTCSD